MWVCCPWLTQLGGHQCPQHRQLSRDPLRRHLTSRDGVRQGNAGWVVTTFCGQLNPVVVHHAAKPYMFRQPRSLLVPESHPLTHRCSLHGCFITRIGKGRSFLSTSSLKVQVPPTACEPRLPSPLSLLLGFHFKALTHLGVVAYTYVSTQVEEAGGLLQFQGQFGLCGNFQASRG